MSRKQMMKKGGSREGPPTKMGPLGIILFVLGIAAVLLVGFLLVYNLVTAGGAAGESSSVAGAGAVAAAGLNLH